MKKLIIFFCATATFILLISYILLFTKKGNNYISSYVENKINSKQKDFYFKVDEFSMTTSDINLQISINNDSKINIFGKLSIFSQSLDLKYDINLVDLKIFKNSINKDMKGVLNTNGIFRGDLSQSIIQGTTNIAESQTKYFFKLVDFKLTDIFIDLKDAKLDQLLAILNQPILVNGNLNLKANIKNLSFDNLDGSLNYNITKGVFKNTVFNKIFNKRMDTRIVFSSEARVSFQKNIIKIDSQLKSTVADLILSNFFINIQNNSSRADYSMDLKNLSRLNGLIEKKLNGQFLTKGTIRQKNEKISVNGFSEYFEGLFSYKFDYIKSEFKNILLNLEDGRLEKFLFFLNEPIYGIGDLDFDLNLKNLDLYDLSGTSNVKIKNAKLINDVINTVFEQDLKNNISFNIDATTNYNYNTSISDINIYTNIFDLNISKGVYNFLNNKFIGIYDLNINDLSKINDITKLNLQGNANLKGDFERSEVILKINGKTNLLNSDTNFNLANNNVTVNINNINFKDLCRFFNQAEIFNGNTNLDFKYNLFNKIGTLNANLQDVYLEDIKFLDNFKNIIKYDLTKINYKNVQIYSKIDNNKISTDLLMQSDNSKIEIKNSLIDYSKNIIDANLNLYLYDNKLNFMINGGIKNPNLSFVSEDFLKNQSNKEIKLDKDEIEKKIKKLIKNTDEKKVEEAIKKIKSIF